MPVMGSPTNVVALRIEIVLQHKRAVGEMPGIECAPLTERWQSGRMYLTRNQAMSQDIRGFESHPLRQTKKALLARAFLFCGEGGVRTAGSTKVQEGTFAQPLGCPRGEGRGARGKGRRELRVQPHPL